MSDAANAEIVRNRVMGGGAASALRANCVSRPPAQKGDGHEAKPDDHVEDDDDNDDATRTTIEDDDREDNGRHRRFTTTTAMIDTTTTQRRKHTETHRHRDRQAARRRGLEKASNNLHVK